MHASGAVPGGGVVGGGVVGGGVVADALGVAAGAGEAAGVEPELSFELFELFELDDFAGTLVVEALSPLFESSPEPSSVCAGMVGAEQPASEATPTVERARRERATSWVAAFICRFLWLRSPCSVTS
jgi:hypothetical protein